MDLGGWIVALLTVFLGALLAFLVDNLRERRRLREWTRRYLHDVHLNLAESAGLRPLVADALEESATAVGRLLTGEDPDWQDLSSTTVTSPPTIMDTLRGEGLSVVSPDVVTALQRIETATSELHLRSTHLERRHERFVLPLYLGRRLPDAEERVGLELYASELRQFQALAAQAFDAVDRAVEVLDAAGDRPVGAVARRHEVPAACSSHRMVRVRPGTAGVRAQLGSTLGDREPSGDREGGSSAVTSSQKHGGLLHTLVSGAKEIPRNASWLAGKAVPHDDHDNGHDNGHRVNGEDTAERGLVQRTTDALRDALPGHDSVETRLARAHESAQEAHEAEERAVAAAERAHELVERVDAVEAEEKQRLADVRRQQEAEVERRVDLARREADDHVTQARRAAEAEAERVEQEEHEVSNRRQEAVRAEADRAQTEAHERFAEATEQLARARELAEQAAALAQEAAERARHDAERISQVAQQGREQADEALVQAQRMEEHTQQEAATVSRKVNRAQRPGTLTTLSKADLVHLAQERDVKGRSAMSKKQLVAALEKKQ